MKCNISDALKEGICLLPFAKVIKYSSRWENHIRLASFFLTIEEKELAREVFSRVSLGKRTNRYDKAGAFLGLGYYYLESKSPKKATGYLKKIAFQKAYKNCVLSQRARYVLACLYSSQPGAREKVYRLFGSIVGSGNNNSESSRALMAMAVTALNNKDYEVTEKSIEKLLKDYGDTKYVKGAKTLNIICKELKKGRALDKITLNGKNGNFYKHERTVYTPGNAKWQFDRSKAKSGDLILNSIRLISRDLCKKIVSFKMTLESDEPQPRRADGNQLVFLRSADLYIKNL
ncbi:MAG: hypothetical protein U9O87_09745 [Verrucomicrobiota bacterium]|nr:hypothetical protein [Verrucomicrobiota bacterium]